jgi:hypothetical protein
VSFSLVEMIYHAFDVLKVILNTSALNKSTLTVGDKLVQMWPQSVG